MLSGMKLRTGCVCIARESTCVRVSERACVRAFVRACVRTYVRACARACACECACEDFSCRCFDAKRERNISLL